MRVLLATMQFGRGYAFGTERYVTLLRDGLAARGHRAVVLAGDPERRGPEVPLGTPRPDEPDILHAPTRGWAAVRGPGRRAWDALLARVRPDVVHLVNAAHLGAGLIAAARRRGSAAVVTVVDFWWICPRHTLLHYRGGVCSGDVPWHECMRCVLAGNPRPVVRWLARGGLTAYTVLPALWAAASLARGLGPDELVRFTRRRTWLLAALDRAAAVVFLSRGAQQRLGPCLKRAAQHFVPVGLEPRWFAARRTEPLPPGPRDPAGLTLGFVGALAPHKGPHLLLAALRRLGWTRTALRIAGTAVDAGYAAELRAAAAGLRVEFCGRVPTEAMPDFLRGLDLLVVPSTWPENQPQTVLEALTTGTPVLAGRVDGIRELLPDERSLFEPGSVESLAAQLAAWAADPPRARPAAPWTADEMVAATLRVYRAAAGNG